MQPASSQPFPLQPIRLQRLLLAVDFSPVTSAVVAQAAALARAFGASLRVVHVAAPEPDFVGYAAGPDIVREARARELRDEHRELQALADALRAQGLDAKALLVQGPTVASLLREAAEADADLIVLGSHGHGALHRLLLGSVSEGVLREAACPVLVVPDPRREPRS